MTIKTLAGAAAAALIAVAAQSADFPKKSVTMLVPYGAGGVTDTMARLTAAALEKELGESVVVSNKTGAAGTVGLTAVARARPDGYTILMTPAAPLIIQPHLRPLQYDTDSFTYICHVFETPMVLVSKDGADYADFAAVMDRAKAAPGSLTYGSAGAGSLPHVSMIRMLQEAGADMRHVPMQGDAGAVTGALGGHTDFALVMSSSVGGKGTKNIAIFSDAALDTVPGASTAAASGYDYSFNLWGGLLGPKDMPEEARAVLASACETAVASPEFAAEMAKMAAVPVYGSGADFEAKTRSESEVSGEVLRGIGMVGN